MNARTRWAVTFGSAGLVAGLALGVTGFATAASPSPSRASGHHRQFGEHFGRYGGLVVSISDSTLTVRTPRGTETVALTGSTTYFNGRDQATRAAVKAGEIVRVRLVDPTASKPVAAVVRVIPAHIAGWVTAVGSDTLTVTDVSGFTRTIRTTGATAYVKDGTAATRSALSIGTLIRAIGTVDADGTTLDATRVATGLPPRWAGDAHPGDAQEPPAGGPDETGGPAA